MQFTEHKADLVRLAGMLAALVLSLFGVSG